MFADEARFGRINRPRPCWAPRRIRPQVASQLIRECIYLYGAGSPKDGTCVYLTMPTSNTACFQSFLSVLWRRFARQDILLVLDGAPNHRCGDLSVPNNITLLFLPPYAPELNPKENLWDEIREKIFKNYALKSIDAVYRKLDEAILYIERNPEIVKSITSFPYIATRLLYIPSRPTCNEMTMTPDQLRNPTTGSMLGGGIRMLERTEPEIVVPDPFTAEAKNRVRASYPNFSAALTTAGGLLFTGLRDGQFIAYDDTSLEPLWKINVGAGINAPPMNF